MSFKFKKSSETFRFIMQGINPWKPWKIIYKQNITLECTKTKGLGDWWVESEKGICLLLPRGQSEQKTDLFAVGEREMQLERKRDWKTTREGCPSR